MEAAALRIRDTGITPSGYTSGMSFTPAERALADQVEAKMRETLEASLRPQSQDDIDHTVAETFRRMGLPVIDAKGQQVGDELVFDLTVAQPRGEG